MNIPTILSHMLHLGTWSSTITSITTILGVTMVSTNRLIFCLAGFSAGKADGSGEAWPSCWCFRISHSQPPGMYKSPVNNGINYQPQLVQDFSHQPYLYFGDFGWLRMKDKAEIKKIGVCVHEDWGQDSFWSLLQLSWNMTQFGWKDMVWLSQPPPNWHLNWWKVWLKMKKSEKYAQVPNDTVDGSEILHHLGCQKPCR